MQIDIQAAESLSQLLGARFSQSQADRELHGASETFHRAPPPDAVVWPVSTEEVSAIMRI